MAVLAIVQPDPRTAARLNEALTGPHDPVLCSDWDHLFEAADSGRTEACLVDADHPSPGVAAEKIRSVRAKYPDVAVIAYTESSGSESYVRLAALRVDGVLTSASNRADIRRDVDQALAIARGERIARYLRERYPSPGPEAVAWAVTNAGRDTDVAQLALGLGMSQQALREGLAAAGMPTPQKILVYGRLLLAGARLGNDGRTSDEAAFSVGYSVSAALSRAMKQNAGLTPARVSQEGGLSRVLDALFPAPGGSGTGGVFARLASIAILLLAAGCASFGRIDSVLVSPGIAQTHVGVLAVDAETGRILYEHQSEKHFVPASNQKILVTATALTMLGPEYRFRTEVYGNGGAMGTTLDGDLIVVASGDPSFSDRYWPSGTAALEALGDSLRASGLTHVAGSVFVDVSAWDSATVGPTWEVEDLRYAYGSTGGAFAIDEGEIELIIEGGRAVGSPARVRWSPMGTSDFVYSRLKTSPPDSATRVRPSYLPETRRLVLEGNVEYGTVDTISYAMRDPVRQASAALAEAIGRSGVELQHGWEVKWTEGEPVGRGCEAGAVPECPTAGLLAAIESPPISALIAGSLKPSQNWITEQLVRALGAAYGDEGSWSEGVDLMEAFLVEHVGVVPEDISARDGSGLSAYNLVTPRAVVRVLQHMREGEFAEVFRQAMAQPQEEDSTLEGRLDGLEGRVFAKTGTISNVNSLSGYLVRDNGQEVIFSILSNGSGLPASYVRGAIDEIVRELAR